MYRAPSKRTQLIKRIAVYSGMTAGVLILVIFLVFVMLGYRFSRDTGTIQQGGLVQFASRPNDASVTIGNAKLGARTPSKITVNPGSYDVSMSRSGYKNWNKSVNVRAGEVLWLNYAQMVPESVETKQLTKFDAVAGVKSSPNGDRFAILQDATKPVITFVDITAETPKLTTVTIPAESLPEGKTPTYTLGEWANDSDRLLVNVSYETTTERLLVDRRDQNDTINITKRFDADIAEAVFDPRSSERIIARSLKGDVRIINTADESQSSVIADKVTYMSLYGNDAVMLVQAVEEGVQSVGYVSLGSDEVRELKRVQSADRVLVAAGNYFSEPHIAVSVGAQLDAYKLRSLPSSTADSNISMSSIYSVLLPAPADQLSIKSGGRFVLAQYAGGLMTYDIELQKQTITSFTSPVSGELRWLDKYHFYTTNGTHLDVLEFDGANAHQITALTTQFDAVQTDDGTFIYTINATNEGFALQRSRMILE